jgi:hypothetical protein
VYLTFPYETLTNSVAPEPEGSSPHSQQPPNGPYPEPGESTPHPPTDLPKVHFEPILPSTPWSFKWSFPSGFPTKTLYTFLPSPMRATCPALLNVNDQKYSKLKTVQHNQT